MIVKICPNLSAILLISELFGCRTVHGGPLPSDSAPMGRVEQVVYTTLAPHGWEILLFDASSGKARPLASDLSLDYNPAFSPDGRWLVFTSERRGNPDLWALNLSDDTDPILLTPSDTMQDAAAFSPDGRSIAFVDTRDGNAEIYLMPFRPDDPPGAFRAAQNISRSQRGDFRPAFSPDGRYIAFSSDRGVPFRSSYPDGEIARARGLPEEAPWPVGSDIYIMEVDGSNPVRLTDANGWDGSPAWSRDGQTIYFYSERDGLPFIWRMKSDGTDQKPLCPECPPGLSPAVMNDGRVAYFTPVMRGDDPDLSSWRVVSAAADGTNVRSEGPEDQDCRGPRFRPGTGDLVWYGHSPSHQRGAYFQTALFRAPGQRTHVQLPDRTLDVQALHRHFPVFSPDGREIVSVVMVSGNDTEGTRLVVAPLNGGKGRELYRPDRSGWQLGLGWAGDWIAFGAGPEFAPVSTRVDIWKVRRDGSGAVNLTPDSSANDAWPSLSPDGKRIVFRSGRDGNFEIYIMGAEGGNVRRLTNDPGLDTMPVFSPDGNHIAFSSNRDGKYGYTDFNIYLLNLTAEGGPGQLQRLTSSSGPDMHVQFSPDGEWIVYASHRGGFIDELLLSFTESGQTYGEIYAQRLSDGVVVRLTHNKWEDGPCDWGYVRLPDRKP